MYTYIKKKGCSIHNCIDIDILQYVTREANMRLLDVYWTSIRRLLDVYLNTSIHINRNPFLRVILTPISFSCLCRWNIIGMTKIDTQLHSIGCPINDKN